MFPNSSIIVPFDYINCRYDSIVKRITYTRHKRSVRLHFLNGQKNRLQILVSMLYTKKVTVKKSNFPLLFCKREICGRVGNAGVRCGIQYLNLQGVFQYITRESTPVVVVVVVVLKHFPFPFQAFYVPPRSFRRLSTVYTAALRSSVRSRPIK